MSQFESFRIQHTPIIRAEIKRVLSKKWPFSPQHYLQESMLYSAIAKSKLFRPSLALCTYSQFKPNHPKEILSFAVALELIHTYSLIHDDLPAMDNDDIRRGQPSNHIKYNEATAILAGDTLQCFAFELIISGSQSCFKAENILNALSHLTKNLGIDGMAGGQQMDLSANSISIENKEHYLDTLHQKKTGALIESAMVGPAILSGQSQDVIDGISTFAKTIGLLFQITDDILDVTSNANVLGKTIGKDIEDNKLTYVTLYGLKIAQEKQEACYIDARQQLQKLNQSLHNSLLFEDLILFLHNRDC